MWLNLVGGRHLNHRREESRHSLCFWVVGSCSDSRFPVAAFTEAIPLPHSALQAHSALFPMLPPMLVSSSKADCFLGSLSRGISSLLAIPLKSCPPFQRCCLHRVCVWAFSYLDPACPSHTLPLVKIKSARQDPISGPLHLHFPEFSCLGFLSRSWLYFLQDSVHTSPNQTYFLDTFLPLTSATLPAIPALTAVILFTVSYASYLFICMLLLFSD